MINEVCNKVIALVLVASFLLISACAHPRPAPEGFTRDECQVANKNAENGYSQQLFGGTMFIMGPILAGAAAISPATTEEQAQQKTSYFLTGVIGPIVYFVGLAGTNGANSEWDKSGCNEKADCSRNMKANLQVDESLSNGHK